MVTPGGGGVGMTMTSRAGRTARQWEVVSRSARYTSRNCEYTLHTSRNKPYTRRTQAVIANRSRMHAVNKP